jgi:peptidyl-prolyl cis-trans isomerase SurA
MQARCRSSVTPTCRPGCGASSPLCRRVGTIFAIAITALCMITGTMPRAQAQHVVAVVNGIPITSYDVDQRTRLIQLSGTKPPGRKEVLEELIDEKVKLLEAKRFGLEASDADVNRHYATMASRMGMNSEQLTQVLNRRGVNPSTLRSRLRSEVVWGELVRGRYQASLQVGEGDVQHMLRQSTEDDDKGAVGHVYTLRPILFIVPQGSPSSLFDVRRREAEAFRGRVSDCKQAVALAREMRDVAVRDTIIRNSAGLPEQMRKMLNSLEIGKLTVPEPTKQGIEVFALCGKETTRTDTPRKHETRQKIFAERYEAQSKQYLERIRRAAMIEYK